MARTSKDEFPSGVRNDALRRANGRCEACGTLLRPGRIQIDHKKAVAFGGKPVLSNAQVLGDCCYTPKNANDNAAAKRSNRITRKNAGIRTKQGRPLPGTRASGIRKRMNGNVERW